jgi:5-methylcytosine-specific restriction endonuclease McrA
LKRNEELIKMGKKVCTKCVHVRLVTEFSTSLGNRKGKLNQICDRCLSAVYAARGSELNYKFWRARAYSLNTVAKSRMSRELRVTVRFDALPYLFKPQDLLQLFEDQSGRCHYCKVRLTRRNTCCDHKTPISREGTHSPDNICLACVDCNHLKSTRTEDEFRSFVQVYAKRFV